MVTLFDKLTRTLKEISGVLSDGSLFSGHPELVEMDLERDFAEIDRLFAQEEDRKSTRLNSSH